MMKDAFWTVEEIIQTNIMVNATTICDHFSDIIGVIVCAAIFLRSVYNGNYWQNVTKRLLLYMTYDV